MHAYNIDGHPWRGYIVLDKTQQSLIKEIQAYKNDEKRPVWFLFSGVNSQLLTQGIYAILVKLNCCNI